MAKQETSRRKIEYGGKPALTDEANRIGSIEARKGITISTLNDELPEELEVSRPNSSGRPPKNIFQEKKKRGGTCQFRDLADARNYVVNQHRLWQNTYKEETTSINIPTHRCRLPSWQFRNEKKPIWTVWRAGEYCEILAGRNWPEERADRRGYNAQVEPLANECRWFWSWLNVAYEYQSMIAPGKKRNAEQHFKAALSAFLTRRYLLPKGG